MKLTPDSWGSEDLREYNPCHDPKDGKFAAKGAGRCTDRFVQQRKDIRQASKEIRKSDDQEAKDKLTGWAARRREARQIINQYPWFIRPDIRRALKDERVTTLPVDDMGTATSPAERSIMFNPHEIVTKGFGSKRGLTSVYRHEVGHVNPTPLGREARVAGLDLKREMLSAGGAFEIGEEIRAWRNAIVASRGKVDWGTVKHGIESHIHGRLVRDKIDGLVRQGRTKKFITPDGGIGTKLDLSPEEAKKIDRQIAQKAVRLYARVERHLKRYAALVARKTPRKKS